MHHEFYIDKYKQILIKADFNIYNDKYAFALWYHGCEGMNLNVLFYKMDEVRLLEEQELVMYKLSGEI